MRNIDLEAEAKFENRKASGERVRSKQSKFYWATKLSIDYHNQLTYEVIQNKNVLEIGCASGYDAVEYAKFSKSYVGVDISDIAISNCHKLKLTNAEFHCTNGHKLPVESKSIDYIIVNSLLHHLNLIIIFPEIIRVLNDDGRLVFREPLGTNPIFQLYRFLTPSARTVDERPITFKDLELMRSYFHFENVSWFGFLNILSAFLRFNLVRITLTKVDRMLSYTPLKYFFWQFSGIVKVKNTHDAE